MPVSLMCESQTDVSSTIRNTLSVELNNSANSSNTDTSIQKQFVASAKRALLNKIDYEEVNNFNHVVNDMLKTKYIVLKPPSASSILSPQSNNGKLTDEKETKTGKWRALCRKSICSECLYVGRNRLDTRNRRKWEMVPLIDRFSSPFCSAIATQRPTTRRAWGCRVRRSAFSRATASRLGGRALAASGMSALAW